MKVYVGRTCQHTLIAKLNSYGWGEMTVRGELLPKRTPWAFDNGCFRDFKAGTPFAEQAFQRDVDRIRAEGLQPDFLVVPDLVAAGPASLDLSLRWAPRLAGAAPLYLVVQDGMEEHQVSAVLEPFAGIFVGGSTAWKLATAASWARLAHARGRQLHIGRVGSMKRVRWAAAVGADSIDSCLPLWSAAKLDRFRRALHHAHNQLEMNW